MLSLCTDDAEILMSHRGAVSTLNGVGSTKVDYKATLGTAQGFFHQLEHKRTCQRGLLLKKEIALKS